MRIARFFAGGTLGATVAVALSGCVGAPAVQIYGGLSEICFSTRSAEEGFFALIGITVENDSARDIILREARPIELVNAVVGEISVALPRSAYSTFGIAPGGSLSPEQRPLWNGRRALDGVVVEAGTTAELIVELYARDYTSYAGLRGMHVKYDDGWFSATSQADSVVGFVPPWTRCSTTSSAH